MKATLENVEWTWSVKIVDMKRSDNNLSDVVRSVHWSLDGEFFDTDKEQYHATYSSVTELPSPNPESFTPSDNLNKKIIMQWVVDLMGEQKELYCKQKVLDQINQRCNNDYTKNFK